MRLKLSLIILVIVTGIAGCGKEVQEVNVYSGRHYRSDEELFSRFTHETGIKINLIKADTDQLINRILIEGESALADVIITADASRLPRAVEQSVLQPIDDTSLLALVPKNLRDPMGYWMGLTKRTRVIVYHRERVNPADLSTYEDLVSDKWRGRILVRSSQSHYNQSLLASMIAANGNEAATEWAEGIVQNMAQNPKGNDRDQVKAIAAGVGDLALINTYYLGLLMRSAIEEERQVAAQVELFFPNQIDRGAHINLSGMGLVAGAQNKKNALRLMEFLLRKESQEYLTFENFEYPIIEDAEMPQLLKDWGNFKADSLSISTLGKHLDQAMLIFNKSGWK